MIPLHCVRTSNFLRIFIVFALFYTNFYYLHFAFTVKKTKQKSKFLFSFMYIQIFCGAICLHFREVIAMLSCQNQFRLQLAVLSWNLEQQAIANKFQLFLFWHLNCLPRIETSKIHLFFIFWITFFLRNRF